MKLSDLPAGKFTIPFADSAGSGYVTSPIPAGIQSGGRASLTQGFPPVTFQPVGAGGIPPWGADMNGILNQITLWSQWQNGGGLVPYDSAFATAIGGYPQSAVLTGTPPGVVYLSIIDDNTSDPNAGGAGWIQVATAPLVQSGRWTYVVGTGSANAWALAPNPTLASYAAGRVLWVIAPATNTSTSMTVNISGLGTRPIKKANGQNPEVGDIVSGVVYPTIDDGTNVRIVAQLPSDIAVVQNLTYVGSWSQNLPNATVTTITNYTPITSFLLDATLVSGVLTIGPKSAGMWMAIFNAVSPNAGVEIVATVQDAATGGAAIGYGTAQTSIGAPGTCAVVLTKLAAGNVLSTTCRQVSGGSLTITGRVNFIRIGG